MAISLRPHRAVFRFSGPDAHKLLNDVVTGRVPAGPGPATWWALLTPQGKILAEGLAGWADDAIWLDVHVSVADDFFRRMRMYRLRAQVEIDDLRQSHSVGWAETAGEAISHQADFGPVTLGTRIIGPREAGWVADAAYRRARVAAGIAELGEDFAPDTTFAHDIGMDLLAGIDFAKGCYVGQEVVSRMKHRGTARRRPVVVSGLDDADAGAAVMAGEREAGTVGAVADGAAVAIIRLDRISDAAAVAVNGKAVRLQLPAWARYGFGESAEAD
jgi:tRNA-modifying protein YgfZ